MTVWKSSFVSSAFYLGRYLGKALAIETGGTKMFFDGSLRDNQFKKAETRASSAFSSTSNVRPY